MISEISEDPLTRLSVAERVEKLSDIKVSLRGLILEASLLRGHVEHIEASLEPGDHADGKELVALYDAMGIVLPEVVGRTFEEVKDFHRSITRNRRVHLLDSLSRSKDDLSKTMANIEELESLKERVLAI